MDYNAVRVFLLLTANKVRTIKGRIQGLTYVRQVHLLRLALRKNLRKFNLHNPKLTDQWFLGEERDSTDEQ